MKRRWMEAIMLSAAVLCSGTAYAAVFLEREGFTYADDGTLTITNEVVGNGIGYRGCFPEHVVIEPGAVEIESDAFRYMDTVTDISIPDGVTKIGENAFNRCSSLAQLIIPDSVTEIGEGAFSECGSLTQLTLSDQLTVLPGSMCAYCSSLQTVDIPEGVVEIGGGAFSDCTSLKSVTLPAGLQKMIGGVFDNCSSLESINIPIGVTEFGDALFKGCSSLREINYAGTREQWNEIQNRGYAYIPNTATINYEASPLPENLPTEEEKIAQAQSEMEENGHGQAKTEDDTTDPAPNPDGSYTIANDGRNSRYSCYADVVFPEGFVPNWQGIAGIQAYDSSATRLLYAIEDSDCFEKAYGFDYIEDSIFADTTPSFYEEHSDDTLISTEGPTELQLDNDMTAKVVSMEIRTESGNAKVCSNAYIEQDGVAVEVSLIRAEDEGALAVPFTEEEIRDACANIRITRAFVPEEP